MTDDGISVGGLSHYSGSDNQSVAFSARSGTTAGRTNLAKLSKPIIDLSAVAVSIEFAHDIQGKYPFIVVCLDNQANKEIFKTKSKVGGENPVKFNETFDFNLALEDKSKAAQGLPPPQYLTFHLYDRADPNLPSLGSAGVLLRTLRQQGDVSGDFKIINGGSGSLSLFLTAQRSPQPGIDTSKAFSQRSQLSISQYDPTQPQQQKPWYKSNGAKIATGVAVVSALTAAAVGVAVAVGKRNKNKKKDNQTSAQQQNQQAQENEIRRRRNLSERPSSSADDLSTAQHSTGDTGYSS